MLPESDYNPSVPSQNPIDLAVTLDVGLDLSNPELLIRLQFQFL